jgi:predicted ester cyclase
MGALDTITALNAAINAQQWDTAARLLTDDFVFSGATPQPQNKQAFLASQQAWFAGVPDWHVAIENPQVDGDVVRSTVHLSGTHSGTLAFPGQPPIPPTGRRFSTNDSATATIRGDQIASIAVVNGSPNVFQQLGVQ